MRTKKIIAFTLVEIMIVIAIIGIVIAIALPAFMRAREISRARACQENLAQIDGAIDMYAIEHKKGTGDTVDITELIMPNSSGYLKRTPFCSSGGTYGTVFNVSEAPTCSIGSNPEAPYAPHLVPSAIPVP